MRADRVCDATRCVMCHGQGEMRDKKWVEWFQLYLKREALSLHVLHRTNSLTDLLPSDWWRHTSHEVKFSRCSLFSNFASNPVLCGWTKAGCASEVPIDSVVKPEVLLTINRSCFAIKLASCNTFAKLTVDMPHFMFNLPGSHSALLTLNTPYVHDLIRATLCLPDSKQIMSFKLCACVVSVHKTFIREVARGS